MSGGTRDLMAAAVERFLRAQPDSPGVIVSVRGPADLSCDLVRPASAEVALSADSVFRTASVTKSVTALAVLRLVERGAFALDDPVGPLLPATLVPLLPRLQPRADEVTVRMLLQHTGGLHDHWGDERWMRGVLDAPHVDRAPDEPVVWSATHGAPVGPPGASFHYSDTGYRLLGSVVEHTSGHELARAFRDLLPLDELSRTWMEGREPARAHDADRAPMRTFGDDPWRWHPSYDNHAAGGLVSTAADLARLVQLVAAGEVVSPSSLAQLTRTVPVRPGADYGLGVLGLRVDGVPARAWGHFGYHGAFAFWVPCVEVAVAGSTLSTDPPHGDQPAVALVRGLVAALTT